MNPGNVGITYWMWKKRLISHRKGAEIAKIAQEALPQSFFASFTALR
jgi:hypothetical protein